jgi:hypothetical protein
MVYLTITVFVLIVLVSTITFLPFYANYADAVQSKGDLLSSSKVPKENQKASAYDYLFSNYTNTLGKNVTNANVTISKFNVTNFRVDTYGGWFIYAVWQENNHTKNVIYFDRSVDGGKTWGPAVPISNGTQISTNPHVGAFANEVYVVWEGKNPINTDVFLRKSIDGGTTFGKTINLSHSAGLYSSTESSILIDKTTSKVIIWWVTHFHPIIYCYRC